jgi:hypothetical protein
MSSTAASMTYSFLDADSGDREAIDFDVFTYLMTRTELFSNIASQYVSQDTTDFMTESGDSRFGKGEARLKNEDSLIEENKISLLKFIRELPENLAKVDPKTKKTHQSSKKLLETVLQIVKKYGLTDKAGLRVSDSIHNFFAWLSFVFSLEFLLNFAKVGDRSVVKIDHSKEDVESIFKEWILLLKQYSASPENERSKYLPLGEFLQDLLLNEEYQTYTNETTFIAKILNKVKTREDELKLQRKSREGSALHCLKNVLLSVASADKSQIKWKEIVTKMKTFLMKYLFMTELFQREQEALWKSDPIVDELMWHYARIKCKEWDLYSGKEEIPGLKEAFDTFASNQRNLEAGTRINLLQTTDKKMMITRYNLKNRYSVNILESSLDFTSSSKSFGMFFMAHNGDSLVSAEGKRRYKLEAEIYDSITMNGVKIASNSKYSMTEVDLRSAFTQIQVAMGIVVDIVTTFYNYVLYYDLELERIRICRMLRSSKLNQKPDSREFNNIQNNGCNIHAVTSSQDVLRIADKIRVVVSNSKDKKVKDAVFLLFVLEGKTKLRDFIKEYVVKYYYKKEFHDKKPDQTAIEANVTQLLQKCVIDLGCNADPQSEEFSNQLKSQKQIHQPGSTFTLDDLKTEMARLETLLRKERARHVQSWDNQPEQYMWPDIVISLDDKFAKDHFTIDQPTESRKIAFKPTLTAVLNYSFKIDSKMPQLIEQAKAKAYAQVEPEDFGMIPEEKIQRPTGKIFANLHFSLESLLPYYYFMDVSRMKNFISIFSDLEIKLFDNDLDRNAVLNQRDQRILTSFKNKFLGTRYKMTSFVVEDFNFRLIIYEVTVLNLRDVVDSPKYEEIFRKYVAATYGQKVITPDADKKTPEFDKIKEQIRGSKVDRTFTFLTRKTPLTKAEKEKRPADADSYTEDYVLYCHFTDSTAVRWILLEREEAF